MFPSAEYAKQRILGRYRSIPRSDQFRVYHHEDTEARVPISRTSPRTFSSQFLLVKLHPRVFRGELPAAKKSRRKPSNLWITVAAPAARTEKNLPPTQKSLDISGT